MIQDANAQHPEVHGDIRHLEIKMFSVSSLFAVHGDIRHLESSDAYFAWSDAVHGDIRHLEIGVLYCIVF